MLAFCTHQIPKSISCSIWKLFRSCLHRSFWSCSVHKFVSFFSRQKIEVCTGNQLRYHILGSKSAIAMYIYKVKYSSIGIFRVHYTVWQYIVTSYGIWVHGDLFLNCWWRYATLFDLFVFILQYEDMSRRIHCLSCWRGLGASWSRIEVGLLVVCWDLLWIFKVKVSR